MLPCTCQSGKFNCEMHKSNWCQTINLPARLYLIIVFLFVAVVFVVLLYRLSNLIWWDSDFEIPIVANSYGYCTFTCSWFVASIVLVTNWFFTQTTSKGQHSSNIEDYFQPSSFLVLSRMWHVFCKRKQTYATFCLRRWWLWLRLVWAQWAAGASLHGQRGDRWGHRLSSHNHLTLWHWLSIWPLLPCPASSLAETWTFCYNVVAVAGTALKWHHINYPVNHLVATKEAAASSFADMFSMSSAHLKA